MSERYRPDCGHIPVIPEFCVWCRLDAAEVRVAELRAVALREAASLARALVAPGDDAVAVIEALARELDARADREGRDERV